MTAQRSRFRHFREENSASRGSLRLRQTPCAAAGRGRPGDEVDGCRGRAEAETAAVTSGGPRPQLSGVPGGRRRSRAGGGTHGHRAQPRMPAAREAGRARLGETPVLAPTPEQHGDGNYDDDDGGPHPGGHAAARSSAQLRNFESEQANDSEVSRDADQALGRQRQQRGAQAPAEQTTAPISAPRFGR